MVVTVDSAAAAAAVTLMAAAAAAAVIQEAEPELIPSTVVAVDPLVPEQVSQTQLVFKQAMDRLL
jgi:hypothetical protein